jgi:hypothetical protein
MTIKKEWREYLFAECQFQNIYKCGNE